MSDLPIALTIAKAVAASGTGPTTLYAEIAAGRLKAKKAGRKTLILTTDLLAWLEALPKFKSGAAPEMQAAHEMRKVRAAARRVERTALQQTPEPADS